VQKAKAAAKKLLAKVRQQDRVVSIWPHMTDCVVDMTLCCAGQKEREKVKKAAAKEKEKKKGKAKSEGEAKKVPRAPSTYDLYIKAETQILKDAAGTLQGLHALHTARALTAKEFQVAKARALGTGGPAAAEPVPANRATLEPPTCPAAAADRGARGGGQRMAVRAVPEPTCVQSAKRRAVEAGACAAAAGPLPLDPRLKVIHGPCSLNHASPRETCLNVVHNSKKAVKVAAKVQKRQTSATNLPPGPKVGGRHSLGP
jgi:hypothetical protein